jgi:hypothetical protein
LVGRLDTQPDQSQQLRVARVRKVEQLLRWHELRIAFHHALLPGDIAEIPIVEHEHDEAVVRLALIALRDRDERVDAAHLHRPVHASAVTLTLLLPANSHSIYCQARVIAGVSARGIHINFCLAYISNTNEFSADHLASWPGSALYPSMPAARAHVAMLHWLGGPAFICLSMRRLASRHDKPSLWNASGFPRSETRLAS